MRRIAFVVAGRVQGVGFRASAAGVARRLQLEGHVRNRGDGAVEGEAQGERAAIDAFVAWLRQGPPLAHVTDLQVRDLPPASGAQSFDVRR